MKPSLIAAALAASAPAWAQDLPASVVVTGNPLGAKDLATPASVLTGKDLVLRRGSTLGETLDGLPGVSSTYFGPNANRPVIRGQDGDRIRVLGNGGASFDASSLSFDHAVPIDPLVVERVEVLRGPAALSYGGSAVGGVVNAIDNRIPREAVTAVSGAFEGRLGGAAGERAASALVEGGGGALAWHADAFWRRTDDLSVPDFDRPLEDGSSERRNFIANSASRADGGALGGSFVWDAGYVGASVDTYRNDYGIVAEDDITIRMRRDRIALAGELRPRGGFFSALRAQGAGTDYRHQEIEGDGSVGTTFANDGSDARLEAVHRALALGGGQLEGSFGLQYESSDFSALGEEAFVPSTHTRQQSVFVLERWSWGEGGSVSSGLRAEQGVEQLAGRRSGGVAPAVAVMTGMTGMTVVVRMAPGACGVVGRHRHGIGVPRPVRNGMGQRLPLRQQQGQQGHADDAARGVGAAERLHAVARSRSGSTADRVGWQGVASCHRPPSMPQTTTSGRW